MPFWDSYPHHPNQMVIHYITVNISSYHHNCSFTLSYIAKPIYSYIYILIYYNIYSYMFHMVIWNKVDPPIFGFIYIYIMKYQIPYETMHFVPAF